eukprot:365297-Chlamydomonas_euryale.AAC.9
MMCPSRSMDIHAQGVVSQAVACAAALSGRAPRVERCTHATHLQIITRRSTVVYTVIYTQDISCSVAVGSHDGAGGTMSSEPQCCWGKSQTGHP